MENYLNTLNLLLWLIINIVAVKHIIPRFQNMVLIKMKVLKLLYAPMNNSLKSLLEMQAELLLKLMRMNIKWLLKKNKNNKLKLKHIYMDISYNVNKLIYLDN